MLERKELNHLVVSTLEVGGSMVASKIYDKVHQADPNIFRREHVHGFLSFVKIINQFPDVEQVNGWPKKYDLAKKS